MGTPIFEAATVLRRENLNITVELVLDDAGDVLFNLRATHWRGSEHSNRMYLVCERSMDEALILLSNAVYQRLYVPIDWRKRLYVTGVSGFRLGELGAVENPGEEHGNARFPPRTHEEGNPRHAGS